MNRQNGWIFLTAVILAVLFLLPVPAASAAEPDDTELEIEEIIEEIDLDATVYGDAVWDFPVALEDMNPDFVVLANKHYLLDPKFVCKPLVKIKSMSLNKDGSKKSGDMYVVSKGMELNETCAQALIAMADGARADGYNLYLKSAYRSYQTQKTM